MSEWPDPSDRAWRVVLADDHALVRAGLKAVLDADARVRVVAEAGSLGSLRAAVATSAPDLVLLDITLGEENGLDAVAELLAAPSSPRVLVLTMHGDTAFAQDALRRGAHGYLLKDAAADELARAVEIVMAGGVYLQPALGARLARARPDPVDRLTHRERDVLRLLARGHTNAEIAQELYVSLRTVEAHRAGLRGRLGATSRADLVDAARRLGLE